jgi:hypothetical protein
MWLGPGLDAYASETLSACLMGVVLVPIVLPRGDVVRRHVRSSGEPWPGRAQARSGSSAAESGVVTAGRVGSVGASGRRNDARTGELVVYGASDCCLCEEAMAVLRELAPGLGLSLRYVGIDGQPELERLYREQVPVGFLGGRKVFKYHVDPERLRRAAAHRASRGPGGE